MKKDKSKKENLPAESMQDRFLRAFRQQLRDREIGKIVVNGVVIRMPLGIILSRMKPTKLQMNIITTIMKVIGKNVANELQKESLGSLFSKAEFGEDENTINFVIHEREFGIPRKHREDLDSAVKMMTVFPIEIPVVGKLTGQKYTEHSTLCVIRTKRENPGEDATYVVTMKRDVADLLISRDTEFASLTDISYKEFRSKFSYRFYLFTVSICSAGKIAFSFDYIRKIFSDNVEEHKRYVKFEEDVLSKAQKDLYDIYKKGILHYWFEYHPTAAERKALKQRGNPEEIIFEFHTHPALPKEQAKVIPQKTLKEIEEKLIKEFGIFPNSAKEFTLQLTVDNINAFNEKVEKVREKMKTASKSPNGVAFVAFTNFFKEYGNGFCRAEEIRDDKNYETTSSNEPVDEPEDIDADNVFDDTKEYFNQFEDISKTPIRRSKTAKNEYWRSQFYKVKNLMERFGYNLAERLSLLITFESYDEENKILHIRIPGPTTEVQELIERHLQKLFMWHVTKYFPEDVKIEYTITKYVTKNDTAAITQLRVHLEQQSLYFGDIMDLDGPLFNPRDEHGIAIPREQWKWNYALALISRRVDKQKFSDIYSKLKLFNCKKEIGNGSISLLISIPSRDFYEKIEEGDEIILKNTLQDVFKREIIINYTI